MFGEMLKTCLSTATFATGIRLACPLVIGSVGGCFNEKTGTGNLAYECVMLTGAFFGAYGSYISGNPIIGSLIAMLSGIVLAVIYGILVYHLRCNAMIVSIAYNNSGWALTTLLLTQIWGVRGNFTSPEIVSYKNVSIGAFKNIPVLDTLFNNNIAMVYLAFVIAGIGTVIMYKTPFGLRLRGVGLNPEAARTAGINVRKYKWISLLAMGACMGLAGSYMPLSGLSMFTENMTRGRGFLCLTSILVAKANPFKATLVALLFGYANGLTLVLSTYGYPTQIMTMLPYLMVLVVLVSVGIKQFKGKADIAEDMI